MTVTYTTLTVGRSSTAVIFTVGRPAVPGLTVSGHSGAITGLIAPPAVHLTTETGLLLTTETGDELAA